MSASAAATEAIWHDVECGAYAADLAIWDELAAAAAGPVLELGAGTGRVALRLAHAGHEVVALDSSQALLDELATRADAGGLEVATVRADARALELDRSYGAILAPMQFLHLLGGSDARASLLAAVAAHLDPGGTFAAALLADDLPVAAGDAAVSLLPDVRELDGWIYSSLPVTAGQIGEALEIRRLRQIVSPAGELTETVDEVRLDALSPAELEGEGQAAGLEARERIEIPPTDDHVGSVVCVLEAGR